MKNVCEIFSLKYGTQSTDLTNRDVFLARLYANSAVYWAACSVGRWSWSLIQDRLCSIQQALCQYVYSLLTAHITSWPILTKREWSNAGNRLTLSLDAVATCGTQMQMVVRGTYIEFCPEVTGSLAALSLILPIIPATMCDSGGYCWSIDWGQNRPNQVLFRFCCWWILAWW